MALERLVEWGEASLETSINQPALPHAIIAVNAAEIDASPEEWDLEHCTQRLLAAVRNSISRVPSLQSYADLWRHRERPINTVSDLIHCYYGSFTVIRIPKQGRTSLLLAQMDKLRRHISSRCTESYHAKRKARMLLNSDDLGKFMQVAFDHFSTSLDVPFNFIEASIKTNPIPTDIGGNILKLAISMQEFSSMRGKRIFPKLSKVASSCVLLDCIRFRLG
jgi:hypothetical protein